MDFFIFVFSYLLGSIPFGLIFTKLFTNIDIESLGSGNIGANNVRRLTGIKFGFLTLIFDIAKGSFPVFFSLYFLKKGFCFISIVGFLAFLGHLYSIFLKGRGGKGVATAAGVFLILNPFAFFLSLSVYIVSIFLIKIASVASILSSFSLPFFLYIQKSRTEYLLLSILFFVFITYKHKNNLKRLKDNKEPNVFH